MVEIGRNDPCPCGSGKKYKRCCLIKTSVEISREQSFKTKLIKDILAFSKRHYRDSIDEASEFFWDDFEPERYLSDAHLQMADVNFWEWLIYDWTPDEANKKTLIDLFMENNRRLTAEEIRVLNKMKSTVISLYEVQEVFPEQGLLLKDLLRGGEYDVREKSATRYVKKWDIFASRLLHLDGKFLMGGSAYTYPLREKDFVLQEINREFEEYKSNHPDARIEDFLKNSSDVFNWLWCEIIKNPPKIKLMTTTGEPFVFSKATFEIKDKASVIEGLKKIKEFRWEEDDKDEFTWLSEEGKGGMTTLLGSIKIKANQLTLECNSKERLKKGKKIILDNIPGLLVRKEDVYQEVEDATKLFEHSPEKEPLREIPPEVEQELYSHFMQKHCEGLLNERIPMLNNKTPLQAITTEEGKRKVIEWLKEIENMEEDNKREGRAYYDTSWMWERLGLKRET